jgi:SPP1 gp7 family putative phage head morphogenesis protein
MGYTAIIGGDKEFQFVTTTGWLEFKNWAIENLPEDEFPEIAQLVDHSLSQEIPALIEEIESAKDVDGPTYIQKTLARLGEILSSATSEDGSIFLSDGFTTDDGEDEDGDAGINDDDFSDPALFAEPSDEQRLANERAMQRALEAVALVVAAESQPALVRAITKAYRDAGRTGGVAGVDIAFPRAVEEALNAADALAVANTGRQVYPTLAAQNPALVDRAAGQVLEARYQRAVDWMKGRDVMTPAQLERAIEDMKRAQAITGTGQLSDAAAEALVRERALALKKVSDTTVTRMIQEDVARAVERGQTIQEFIAEKMKQIESGEIPNVGQGYLENVFRTETSNAYGAQRQSIDSSPAVADIVKGYRIMNPADGRSRESHAALNGMEVKAGGAADIALGFPPFSYQCRCSKVPIVSTDPDFVVNEPPDALDRVNALERFSDCCPFDSFDDSERNEVHRDWSRLANMTAGALEQWGKTEYAKRASLDPDAVITRNLRLYRKAKANWDATDIKDANRAISFISRMKNGEQGEHISKSLPISKRDISLLNWGHNPTGQSVPEIIARLDRAQKEKGE